MNRIRHGLYLFNLLYDEDKLLYETISKDNITQFYPQFAKDSVFAP
jgi:hypothetical protein